MGKTRRDWLALAGVLALTAWALLPSLGGEFVTDDYVFLTTSRMVDAPWQAFWQRHFYEPLYFRPVGLVVWWLTERCFGLNYAWHAAFNAALHLSNVVLLWLLLRRFTSGAAARLMGVSWFALGPLSFPAVLWLSDRFDLMAVCFLLLTLLAGLSAGRTARMAAVVFLAALAACWSKEWAFGGCLAATLGLAWMGGRTRNRSLLVAAGAVLAATSVAWVVRISVLDGLANSLAAQALNVDGLMASTWAWASAGARIANALGAGWVALLLLGVSATAALLAGQTSGGRKLLGRCAVAAALLIAISLPQTLTVSGYIALIDTGIFGAATTARFFYGPMAALSGVIAIAFSAAMLPRLIRGATIVAVSTCVIAFGLKAQAAASEFSAWTNREIAPFSVAATVTTDAVAITGSESCVIVFLGTQTRHPYFRMFSDVTVKARTTSPEKTWACHVMTESTPWLFAFPLSLPPADLPLRDFPHIGNLPKPDSTWSSIRYRYRLPASDLATLPNAHFFDWQTDRFVDVTDSVKRGDRKIKSQDQ